MSENKIITKFKALSSGARSAIIGGVAIVAVFTVASIYSDKPGAQRPKPGVEKETFTPRNPGSNEATENVAATLSLAQKEIADQKIKLALLEEKNKQVVTQASADGHWTEISNLVSQVQALQERVNAVSPASSRNAQPNTGATTKANLDGPLPAAGGAGAVSGAGNSTVGSGGPTDATEAPAPSQPGIQVVAEDKAAAKAQAKAAATPSAYLPSGANFEAVLLNGMDAATSIGANRTPTPALLRIKSEAILPNMFTFNVRECFVLIGGFGNMSSERVEMRTETMSCVDEDGTAWEGKIEGYLVGEDGKAGARGRVVSKQGALLAKSFMAGFVGGLGSAFTPQAVPALNLSAGSSTAYQMPSADQVAGSGLSAGLNKSGTALSNFYIKLAEQMFPVVELDAGRKMTIILIKGVSLKMEKKV